MSTEKTSYIAKISAFFAKRYAVTFAIFASIIALGIGAYTTFLQREGFPTVEFPYVVVQAPYFVGDVEKVDEELAKPIEDAIAGIDEIVEFHSSVLDNMAIFQMQFEESITSEEGAELLKNAIESNVTLPEGASIMYDPINVASIDGEHDFLFSVAGDKTTEELEAKAAGIAERLRGLEDLEKVSVKNLISTQVNPETGEEFPYQATFNRVGIKQDGQVSFLPAIDIGIVKKGDIGTLELSDLVREEIQKMSDEGLLEGYEVAYGGDVADILRSQISSLEGSALTGLIVVVIVLFLLVNWRASLVTAVFIPTVMLATFLAMYTFGYTINVISLFALILVLGLFVDDAIVVVEAIDYQKQRGEKGLIALKKAVTGIGSADVMGTLTTILVFAPMIFISGVLGEFIRQIPVTVIIALVLSLIIALTIIPFFSNFIIRDRNGNGKPNTLFSRIGYYAIYGVGDLIRWLADKVAGFVNLYIRKPLLMIIVIIATFALIAFGSSFGSQLKFNIFPTPKDGDQFAILIEYEPGTSLEDRIEIAKDVEDILVEVANGDIKQVDYFNGEQATASAYMPIVLTPIGDRDTTYLEIIDQLQARYDTYESADVKAAPSSVGPPEGDFQFSMQIYSDDTETLMKTSNSVAEYLRTTNFGEDIEIIEVRTPDMTRINKDNGRQLVQVQAKLGDTENTGIVLELIETVEKEYNNEKLAAFGLTTEDVGFDQGQESENVDSFNSLIGAGLFSLGLMYLLLIVQFRSVLKPLLIFIAIPLSFPGVFTGLYLTDNPMSFFVAIGMIGLIGIVVNNTIMLVDFAKQARKGGKSIREAIVEAVKIRFRPLVTTSVTTVVGLLPLALTDPFWESLAFTIIFGLIASTTLVIFAFPAFYAPIEWIDTKMINLVKRILSFGKKK